MKKQKTSALVKPSQHNERVQTISQRRDQENLKNYKTSLAITSGKLYFFAFALAILMLIYIGLFFIQFFSQGIPLRTGEKLSSESRARIERNATLPAPRGRIVDVNGNILAESVPFSKIGLDVKVFLGPEYKNLNQVDSPKFVALAQALGYKPDQLYQKLQEKPKSRYLLLEDQVTPEISKYVRSLRLPGITIEVDYRRFYPYGNAISQTIGLLNNDGIPQFGIEALANQQLQGTPGIVKYVKDFNGRVVEYKELNRPVPGKDVRLTIDIHLQQAAFQAVSRAVRDNQANSATAVLVDVKTGRILAMANAYSFNPNNRAVINPDTLKNYAISNVFEPGSTVKPFVVYTGLQQGVIKKNTLVNTDSYYISGFKIHDVAPRRQLSIRGILQKSSNVGVSKISLLLPRGTLRNTYLNAGFGQPTNLGLIGEIRGAFPAEKDTYKNIQRATFAYGYMQSVTPLQLAHAYTTLGNFGYNRPLSILYNNNLPEGKQTLDPKIVKVVLQLMEGVAEQGGGGIKAAIDNYHVSIKTGTAKKSEGRKGYVDKYIAYTAGVAPSTNPRFALVIVIDNPRGDEYYGGAIAAPVWHDIMQYALRYYNVPEDNMQDNRVVVEPTSILDLKHDPIPPESNQLIPLSNPNSPKPVPGSGETPSSQPVSRN